MRVPVHACDGACVWVRMRLLCLFVHRMNAGKCSGVGAGLAWALHSYNAGTACCESRLPCRCSVCFCKLACGYATGFT